MHVDLVCTLFFFLFLFLFYWHVCLKLRFRVTADGEEDVYTQPVWHAEWTRQVFMQPGTVLFNKHSVKNVINVKRVIFFVYTFFFFIFYSFFYFIIFLFIQNSQRIPTSITVHRCQSHIVLFIKRKKTTVLPSTRPGKYYLCMIHTYSMPYLLSHYLLFRYLNYVDNCYIIDVQYHAD